MLMAAAHADALAFLAQASRGFPARLFSRALRLAESCHNVFVAKQGEAKGSGMTAKAACCSSCRAVDRRKAVMSCYSVPIRAFLVVQELALLSGRT